MTVICFSLQVTCAVCFAMLYIWVFILWSSGTPRLWVEQQEVAGVEGDHVSVGCHYNYPSSVKKWCRIQGSCVEVNSAESGRSQIKDDRSKYIFTVTVRELNREDTGWYWCAAGELQIPVHITVTQRTTTTTVPTCKGFYFKIFKDLFCHFLCVVSVVNVMWIIFCCSAASTFFDCTLFTWCHNTHECTHAST